MNDATDGDPYQAKYLAHQARKREQLVQIMRQRHSHRMFADQRIPREIFDALVEVKQWCPSSCDRQATRIVAIDDRDEKAILSGLLVGAVGWLHRAPLVLLLFGDREAYKAPGEVDYMPYLDAGCLVMGLWLNATVLGLATAYVNPNIRQMNRSHFEKLYGTDVFAGALALGYRYDEDR